MLAGRQVQREETLRRGGGHLSIGGTLLFLRPTLWENVLLPTSYHICYIEVGGVFFSVLLTTDY